MANSQVEYASKAGTWDAADTASTGTVYGPNGSIMGGALTAQRTKRLTYTTPHKPTSHFEIEFSTDQVYWAKAHQFQDASGNPCINTARGDGATAGVYIRTVAGSTTAIDVIFSRYRLTATDEDPSGEWLNTWYWRVVRSDLPLGIGTGLATATQPGAVPLFVEGTWTPTPTGGTNCAAVTAGNGYYQRIGNQVTCHGYVNIDPTSANTLTEFTIELPISRTSATIYYQTSGVSYQATQPTFWGNSNTSLTTASFRGYPVSLANQTVSFTITYNVS
jgi:hypothetical protein